ncbi:hypothetical protein [Deinococcus ruber]|nr:hypothetical protein [Deinococcus ruber]
MPPNTEISSNDLSRLVGLHLTQARRLRRRYLAAMDQQQFTVTDLPILNRAVGLAQLELPNGRSRFDDALTQVLQGAAGKAFLNSQDWTRYIDLRQQFEHQQINLGALWKIVYVHLRIETRMTDEGFQELVQNAVQALLRGHELETLIEEALGRALASELHLTTLLTGPVWPDASTTSSWTETPAGQIIQMLTALLERQPVHSGRMFEGTMVLLTAQESRTLQHLPPLPDAVAAQLVKTCLHGQQRLVEQLRSQMLCVRYSLEQCDRLQRVVSLVGEGTDDGVHLPAPSAIWILAACLDAATRVLLQQCSGDHETQVLLDQHPAWDHVWMELAEHISAASHEALVQ